MTEEQYENEFKKVLSHVEANGVLEGYAYTAGQIRGAITRYCRIHEENKPDNFTDMREYFVPDFMDWWLDENPEIHKGNSDIDIRDAVERYLAFTHVYKTKVKKNTMISDEVQIAAATTLVVKNSLAHAVKSGHSYAKRNANVSIKNFVKALPEVFQNILPIVHGLQTGAIEMSIRYKDDEMSRIIGAYLAGNANVLDMVKKIKTLEIENKE